MFQWTHWESNPDFQPAELVPYHLAMSPSLPTILTMNQLSPFTLWVGNASDCRNIAVISDHEIQHVVQLAIEEAIPSMPREVNLVRIPLTDSNENDPFALQFAIKTVSELIQSKRRTLICCSAGLSRSPATAACALAVVQEKHPDECLNDISKLIRTDVSPGLWKDLLNAYSIIHE